MRADSTHCEMEILAINHINVPLPTQCCGKRLQVFFKARSVLSVLRVVPALHLISRHWPCEPVSSGYPAGHVSNSNPFHRHQCLADSSPGCTRDLGTLGSNPPRNLCNQQKRQKHRYYARYTARPRYRDLAVGSTQEIGRASCRERV